MKNNTKNCKGKFNLFLFFKETAHVNYRTFIEHFAKTLCFADVTYCNVYITEVRIFSFHLFGSLCSRTRKFLTHADKRAENM